MSSESDESIETIPGMVFNARQVRLLKIAVIAMGLMLVGGFALVVATIVYQAMYASGSTAEKTAPAGNPEVTLSVGADTKVSDMAIDGNRLAILVEGPHGSEIVIVGIDSGEVLGRVRLKGE